jgi:hypothetical protein
MLEAARLAPAPPLVISTAEESCLRGEERKRETGFEPATSSLEGRRNGKKGDREWLYEAVFVPPPSRIIPRLPGMSCTELAQG